MSDNATTAIGTFTIASGRITASDPCYKPGAKHAGTFAARNGVWRAAIDTIVDPDDVARRRRFLQHGGDRAQDSADRLIATLRAENPPMTAAEEAEFHQLAIALNGCGSNGPMTPPRRVAALTICHESVPDGLLLSECSPLRVGVDSGQAGLFDTAKFPRCRKTLYKTICALTSTENDDGTTDFGGGTLDFGAVSSSGYGDGGYALFLAKDSEDLAVAARLVFIDDGD